MTWQAALCSPTAADSTALRPRLLPRGVAVVDLEPVDLLARDERVEPDAPSDGRLALHIARGDAVRVAEDLVHLFEREALRLGYLVGGSVSRPNNGVGRRGAERDAYEEEDEDATEKGEDLRGRGGAGRGGAGRAIVSGGAGLGCAHVPRRRRTCRSGGASTS